MRDFAGGAGLLASAPVVRLWHGGVLKRQFFFGAATTWQASPPCSVDGGTADCFLWHVFDMTSDTTNGLIHDTAFDVVGDGVHAAAVP